MGGLGSAGVGEGHVWVQALQPSCCTLPPISFSLCTSDSWPWHFSGAAPLDAYCLPCRSRLSFPLPLPLCQETSSGAAAPPDHDLGTLSLTLRLRLFPLAVCNLCFRFLLRSGQQLNRHYSSQQCSYHIGQWPHCSSRKRPIEIKGTSTLL